MIISTRGRYGLKAMYLIALQGPKEPVSINHIAKTEGISEQYLEQLFKKLRSAGLITSKRGASGGYMLAKQPEEISVGDILRTLEGDLAPTACLTDNCECGVNCECSTRIVWQKLYDGINAVIDGYTLGDMLKDNGENETDLS